MLAHQALSSVESDDRLVVMARHDCVIAELLSMDHEAIWVCRRSGGSTSHGFRIRHRLSKTASSTHSKWKWHAVGAQRCRNGLGIPRATSLSDTSDEASCQEDAVALRESGFAARRMTWSTSPWMSREEEETDGCVFQRDGTELQKVVRPSNRNRKMQLGSRDDGWTSRGLLSCDTRLSRAVVF